MYELLIILLTLEDYQRILNGQWSDTLIEPEDFKHLLIHLSIK